nr:ribonuclease H-like domain-containing protein [Tanacetum cinerariifolium]
VGDKSRRYEAFLHMLCILDGFLDVSFKSVKLVKFLVNLVSNHGRFWLSTTSREVDRWKGWFKVGGVEKVKALGATVEVSGSREMAAWMVVDGGKVRARLVSNVVAKVVLLLLRGFWVEELALDAMEYDDQDKWNVEDDLQAIEHPFSLLEFWGLSSFDGWKLVHVGNRIKSVVVHEIVLHILMRNWGREGSLRDPQDKVHLKMCKDDWYERVQIVWLQKIVSQLANLGVFMSQKDLNLKVLRSLPSEWDTHVVVRRNKSDLDTMSIDDLYNNFKIVEQEVKGTTDTNSNS